MILEGIVTTVNVDGSVNISPMGPIVDDLRIERLVLRPYQTSVTCQNLLRTRQGVFHVTDDVELIARAAVDRLEQLPALLPAARVQGWILADACRWFAFEVRDVDIGEPRARLDAEVVDRGRIRDFFGFNRGKHAVVEAAILATRTAILPAKEILTELRRLAVLVEKTGGPAEHRAFDFLDNYIHQATDAQGANQPAVEGPAAAPGARRLPSRSAMSRRVVEVSTGSRLHFGMLSFGHPNTRQFGGVGAMVDTPGVKLRISAADELAVAGPSAAIALRYAEAVAQAEWFGRRPRCRIDVLSVVSPHVGLGSGTQLALAVAAGLNALYDRGPLAAEQLARTVARGRRSAVGLYGFLHGGLIVEAGKLAEDDLSPLVARLPLPTEWRFLLVNSGGEGLSGEAERQAFERLPAVPIEATARMASDVLLGLLPAAAEHRFEELSQAIFRFGQEAGRTFASLQGGVYSSQDVAETIARLREVGVTGVGQSSWGPTVFAVLPSQQAAESALARLTAAGLPFLANAVIARPLNGGARISVVES